MRNPFDGEINLENIKFIDMEFFNRFNFSPDNIKRLNLKLEDLPEPIIFLIFIKYCLIFIGI